MDFDTSFTPAYGEAVGIGGVRRLTAPNPSPFTFHGTNTYLVGTDTLAVIDPGPDDDAHLAAILSAIGGRPVSRRYSPANSRTHAARAAGERP